MGSRRLQQLPRLLSENTLGQWNYVTLYSESPKIILYTLEDGGSALVPDLGGTEFVNDGNTPLETVARRLERRTRD
jgi:hypothetical protein